MLRKSVAECGVRSTTTGPFLYGSSEQVEPNRLWVRKIEMGMMEQQVEEEPCPLFLVELNRGSNKPAYYTYRD